VKGGCAKDMVYKSAGSVIGHWIDILTPFTLLSTCIAY